MTEYWKHDFDKKAILKSKGEDVYKSKVHSGGKKKKKKPKKGSAVSDSHNIYCCRQRGSYEGEKDPSTGNTIRYCNVCDRSVG